jgi:antitoxin component of RelBE/YafQ-DinJ toxin-antitoxin module
MANNSSITFRINDDSIDKLRKLAEEEGMSLNTLVNRILDSYLEWEFIAPRVGFAPMQKSVLKALFDRVPEDQLKEIAIRAADSFEDELLLMHGKVDLEAVLSLTKNRVRRSGFTLREFESIVENGTIKLVMQHDVGHNWGVFSKTYIERLINNVGYPVKIESTDNSLTIDILKPERNTVYTPRTERSSETKKQL